jgi:hypothetical protein
MQQAQRMALTGFSMFCGVGRGSSVPFQLVPLAALVARPISASATLGFELFVSWISSVVIQWPHTLQESRRVCGEVVHYRLPR